MLTTIYKDGMYFELFNVLWPISNIKANSEEARETC